MVDFKNSLNVNVQLGNIKTVVIGCRYCEKKCNTIKFFYENKYPLSTLIYYFNNSINYNYNKQLLSC